MTDTSRVLLIVPPFAGIDRPSLGAHVLQALATSQGRSVSVLYCNLLFAKAIGVDNYQAIIGAPPLALIGERCLAPFAYERRFSDEKQQREAFNEASRHIRSPNPLAFDTVAHAIGQLDLFLRSALTGFHGTIGFSSTFEQINATIILSRLIHSIDGSIRQIVGGANCEGEMAIGQAALLPYVSHIFSGESDYTFLAFISDPDSFSGRKIITGTPNNDLESLPCPDFSEYLSQFDAAFSASALISRDTIRMPYECSRGCWWGAKHHCTFCGLNGQGMDFREKSPTKVITEIDRIYRSTGINSIFMTDNIMPHRYFRSLLPELASRDVHIDIFFEQKANIDLQKVIILGGAGIRSIQPGIESLISETLSLMKKGIKSSQNIRLLRYCRSVGIEVAWNILYGFPGERTEWYERLCPIIPMLAHLYPPSGICDLSLDRFSPYFSSPKYYGIDNLRPHESYSSAILCDVDLATVAYHFVGDIADVLTKDSDTHKILSKHIDDWRKAWLSADSSPMLHIVAHGDDFLLIDTRPLGLGRPSIQVIDKEQASICVTEHSTRTPLVEWGLANGYCVSMDGRFVPLATADPDMLERFEAPLHLAAFTQSLV